MTQRAANKNGVRLKDSLMVLKSNTIYRVDVVGRAVGIEAIIGFLWYEDLGV